MSNVKLNTATYALHAGTAETNTFQPDTDPLAGPQVVAPHGPVDVEAMNRERVAEGKGGFYWKTANGGVIYNPPMRRGASLAESRANTLAMVKARGWV